MIDRQTKTRALLGLMVDIGLDADPTHVTVGRARGILTGETYQLGVRLLDPVTDLETRVEYVFSPAVQLQAVADPPPCVADPPPCVAEWRQKIEQVTNPSPEQKLERIHDLLTRNRFDAAKRLLGIESP